ncbi:MAG: hypothetical protein ACOXZM_10885 [Eubacteriales bacterium]
MTIGNADAARILNEAIASGTLTQTILLTGPAGSGKRRLALACAEKLLDDPHGRAVRGEHADLLLYDYGDEEFKVEYAQTLKEEAFKSPAEADTRVFVVCHAQRMNIASQNKLLKLLEEPPARVYFFLLCENESALLPTVLSRCLKLTTQPPPFPDALGELKARYPECDERTLTDVLRDADGYPDAAAALLESTDDTAVTELAGACLDAMEKRDELGLWRRLSGENLQRADLKRFLDMLARLTLDRLRERRDDALIAFIPTLSRMREMADGNVPYSHIIGLFPQYFADRQER